MYNVYDMTIKIFLVDVKYSSHQENLQLCDIESLL